MAAVARRRLSEGLGRTLSAETAGLLGRSGHEQLPPPALLTVDDHRFARQLTRADKTTIIAAHAEPGRRARVYWLVIWPRLDGWVFPVASISCGASRKALTWLPVLSRLLAVGPPTVGLETLLESAYFLLRSRSRRMCAWRIWCGLTFELRRARRQTPTGRGRTIYTMTWSGQAVAAVARRRLSEGLGVISSSSFQTVEAERMDLYCLRSHISTQFSPEGSHAKIQTRCSVRRLVASDRNPQSPIDRGQP